MVIGDSEKAILIEAGQTYTSPDSAVVLSRGYWLKLEAVYLRYVSGELVERER